MPWLFPGVDNSAAVLAELAQPDAVRISKVHNNYLRVYALYIERITGGADMQCGMRDLCL